MRESELDRRLEEILSELETMRGELRLLRGELAAGRERASADGGAAESTSSGEDDPLAKARALLAESAEMLRELGQGD